MGSTDPHTGVNFPPYGDKGAADVAAGLPRSAEEHILAALRAAARPLSLPEILARLGLRSVSLNVTTNLKALVRRGLVRRQKRAQRYYYRATDAPTPVEDSAHLRTALHAANAEVEALRAALGAAAGLLTACAQRWLPLVQCASEREGDALTTLEARIDALLAAPPDAGGTG